MPSFTLFTPQVNLDNFLVSFFMILSPAHKNVNCVLRICDITNRRHAGIVLSAWLASSMFVLIQGRFLDLLSVENNCTLWKSIMYNLPVRVMKFLVNAVSDTLNTRANLMRWGKAMTNKCKHCDRVETLNHVSNCCSTFLSQGRYTWRHNNILKCFCKCGHWKYHCW